MYYEGFIVMQGLARISLELLLIEMRKPLKKGCNASEDSIQAMMSMIES